MDLGSLTLNLSSSPKLFEQDIFRAEKILEGFGNAVTNIGGTVVSTFNLIAAHPLGAILSLVGAGVAAFTATATALNVLKNEGVANITTQAKLSEKLGLSAQATAGLQVLARGMGKDFSEVAGAMTAFERRLGTAALGSGDAGAALQRLGLDARQLSHMKTEDALFAVGDALKRLPPGLERTSAAYAILGRHGAELLPIMLRGSEEFKKAEERAKAFGVAVSASDMAMVRSAAKTQKEAEETFALLKTGIGNQLAIGWAHAFQIMLPYFEKYGVELKGAIESLGHAVGISGDWKDVLKAVGETAFGAILANLAILIKLTVEATKQAAKMAENFRKTDVGRIGQAVGLLSTDKERAAAAQRAADAKAHQEAIDAAAKQLNRGGGFADAQAMIDAVGAAGNLSSKTGKELGAGRISSTAKANAEELARSLQHVADAEKILTAARDSGRLNNDIYNQTIFYLRRNLEQAASGAMLEFTAKAREQMATFGMSAAEAARYKLALDGVSDKLLEQVKAVQDVQDAMTKAGDINRSQDDLAKQLSVILQALKEGKISAEQYKQAMEGIQRARDHAFDTDVVKRLEEAKSPFEKWLDDVAKLNEELTRGKLSADDYAKLLGKGAEGLLKGTREAKLPSAVALGSSEAISAINQANATRTDPIEQLKVIQEGARQTQLEQLEWERRLAQTILNGDVFKKVTV